jgi:hypothetical protein
MKLMDTIKTWKEPLVEETAEKHGAKCLYFDSNFFTFARLTPLVK